MRKFVVVLGIALGLTSPLWSQDPRLCAVQNDPVAAAPFNLVDSYCIPSSLALGSVGTPFHVAGSGSFPANAVGQLDVFVIWEPGEGDVGPGESLKYSSSLSWVNSHPTARVKEWVGNFNLTPPQAFMITDTNSGLPAEMVKTNTTAVVTNRTFADAAFPPVPIGRYHIQITGLAPGELVQFSKDASGGHVASVPEPTGMIIGSILGLGVLLQRKRRSRTSSSR